MQGPNEPVVIVEDATLPPLPESFDKAPPWFLDGFRYLSDQMVNGHREQGRAIRQLQEQVFGRSAPPPPFLSKAPAPVPGLAPLPPTLGSRVASSELEVQAAESREIIRDARLARLESALGKQNRNMGIAPARMSESDPLGVVEPPFPERVATFVVSPAGLKFLATIAGAIVSLLTLISTMRGAPVPAQAAQVLEPTTIVGTPPDAGKGP